MAASSGRLYFLDGLRGWAALAVLLGHVFIQLFPYSPASAEFLSNLLLFSGTVAVFIFFVISGFALSVHFVRTGDRQELARTAASRYLRLALPIFAGCALVYLLMLSGLIPPADQRPAPWNEFLRFEPSLWHLLRFSFFDVFFNFSRANAFIIPLWTMPIELFGSMLVFALLALFGRSRWRLWIYGAVYVGVTALSRTYPMLGFYSLFVAGMILAELHHRWVPRSVFHYAPLGALLIFGCFAPSMAAQRPLFTYYATISFCAAVFLLPWTQLFLSNGLSRFLGRISFPLYLVHGPILFSFSYWTLVAVQRFEFSQSATNMIVGFATLPVAIGTAVAFDPINRWSMQVSRRFGAWVVSAIVSRRIAVLSPVEVSR